MKIVRLVPSVVAARRKVVINARVGLATALTATAPHALVTIVVPVVTVQVATGATVPAAAGRSKWRPRLNSRS